MTSTRRRSAHVGPLEELAQGVGQHGVVDAAAQLGQLGHVVGRDQHAQRAGGAGVVLGHQLEQPGGGPRLLARGQRLGGDRPHLGGAVAQPFDQHARPTRASGSAASALTAALRTGDVAVARRTASAPGCVFGSRSFSSAAQRLDRQAGHGADRQQLGQRLGGVARARVAQPAGGARWRRPGPRPAAWRAGRPARPPAAAWPASACRRLGAGLAATGAGRRRRRRQLHQLRLPHAGTHSRPHQHASISRSMEHAAHIARRPVRVKSAFGILRRLPPAGAGWVRASLTSSWPRRR